MRRPEVDRGDAAGRGAGSCPVVRAADAVDAVDEVPTTRHGDGDAYRSCDDDHYRCCEWRSLALHAHGVPVR